MAPSRAKPDDGEAESLADLVARVRQCRACADVLPPDVTGGPRPVLRVSATARLCIAGQAPGARVHASGVPFDDPSGDRLRAWMGIDRATFYDESRLAIVPMGFCFPGTNPKGGDHPPRPECAPLWRAQVFKALPAVETILVVGAYAQAWHIGDGRPMGETVRAFASHAPRLFPLPHPSWRNNVWLKANPWFEAEVLPALRDLVARLL